MRLGQELRLLHVLASAEAAGSLLVHLRARRDSVDGHVQNLPWPHDVSHNAVDVLKDAQDDIPLAQLLLADANQT